MIDRLERARQSGRKIWALLFVLLALFCVIFFAARGRFQATASTSTVGTILAPFEMASSFVGQQIQSISANLWEIATVHEQNKMLKNEVEQLRQQNTTAAEYAAENERLRELLSYKQGAHQFDLLAARVIGRDTALWTSMIVIDRGAKDGVRENMPVVTGKGLVGHVTEVDPVSSKVQLILDARSSVGTLVQRAESRVTGILTGTMDNPYMPQMINIPRNADVEDGDAVVTSGFGGIYPKGIAVGRVASQHSDDSGLLKVAVIETAVDFQRLEDVAIITASREAPSRFSRSRSAPGLRRQHRFRRRRRRRRHREEISPFCPFLSAPLCSSIFFSAAHFHLWCCSRPADLGDGLLFLPAWECVGGIGRIFSWTGTGSQYRLLFRFECISADLDWVVFRALFGSRASGAVLFPYYGIRCCNSGEISELGTGRVSARLSL